MTKLAYYLSKFFPLLLLIIVVSSCVSPKDIVYFQDASNLEKLVSTNSFEPKYQIDDILNIVVSSENPQAARPFNQNVIGQDGNVQPTASGYLIGSDGNIIFPVLGPIKLAGLDRREATSLLVDKLKDYITDVVVSIRITNFKVTVNGAVNRPGSFSIPNERLTIIEAIGLAGDLSIKGKRENIKVIRDSDGVKQFYEVDLTSKEIFNSPVYYLMQNDVVYVEPNTSQVRSAGANPNLFAVVVSLAGLGIAVATFVNTLNN
ncbi:polysaccharide biosynthesis/export family protein [Spongiivirga citrea]|uniref:Polysaccharide export protein n=1 Tax=Spongiivirga citrea TaxID=1481457 RepID=A0A6M0CG71_9FLAO|nr:polysaccharide biosynthesis/export family protein [Spongiivirga citrea]NER16868.1 polysaccharide export protein [Spongiivirga citrea]